MKKIIFSLCAFFALSVDMAAQSAVTPSIDKGDTAWMIVALAFVLLMTIPGLAFFYGGLVRRKNVLTILMQCLVIMSVISLEWVICGYSLSFAPSSGFLSPFIGSFDWVFLNGINLNDISPFFVSASQKAADGTTIGTIPHYLFIMYQCMFAVITPALIIGAFSERIRFKGFLIFSILWAVLIYNPVTHWFWSPDGWLNRLGAIDFAGGAVVHINAGIAAIVTAVMLGRRRDYKGHALPPHNIPYVLLGTALLWVGWFGFNAGSALAANGLAVNALMVTHLSAAAATFVWVLLDWWIGKKPTVVGACTGAIAGLAGITPAAGFVGIGGALAIGVISSLVCFYMVAHIKPRLGYDDTLDAFGVHGISGILGTILVGVFATPLVQEAYKGVLYGDFHLIGIQLLATGATILFSLVGTFVLFKTIDKIMGIRVSDRNEAIGLDETQHGEIAYTNFD